MKEILLNEQWKELKISDLHENERFAISNYGRIKSFKGNPEGNILRGSKVRGYEAIIVKLKTEKHTTKYVHKLVAEHFIEKDSRYQRYVIHVDFDKRNNHVANLCWVTRQTMFAHQSINPNYKRGVISNSKLTESEVVRIKMKLMRDTNKLSLLAREFGITHTQLNRIRRGENWAHVKVAGFD